MQKKLNVYWLNPPLFTRVYYPDVGYMSFKTYCSDHNWIKPIIDWEAFHEVEDILDHIFAQEVDVLCISTYTWNHVLCKEVAKKVKERNNNILVVMGGPQQGYNDKFFGEHPYIDYLCYATGHGEYFMSEFLKQLSEFGYIKEPEKVTYLISRTHQNKPAKTKYVYPEISIYSDNIEYLMNVIYNSDKRGLKTITMYETTRGCPYGCVYCEWGGGTSSKVSAKPMNVIEEELLLISALKFNEIEILDANFGILDRDLDVAKYMGDLKKRFGFPKSVMLYGLAKASYEKREKILDVIYEAGLLKDYFVSIQTMDHANILKNVNRADITPEQSIKLANKYMKLYGSNPGLEIIMGLPGYTLKHFYEEIDVFQQFNSWHKTRNIFTVLPNTPAADPAYIEKFKIKVTSIGSIENEENEDVSIPTTSVINKYKSYLDVVTETFSFTKEDWKQMWFINRVQRVIGPLLKDGVKGSEFFKIFWEDISVSDYYKQQYISYFEDLLSNNKMNDDPSLIDGVLFEHRVLNEYVKANREFYVKYLCI